MDEHYQLVRRMNRAENKIDGVYYYLARYLGVNENTLALLYALDDGVPHSQKEVSEEWMIPRTTINSIVKKMAAEGYITLHTQPHNKEKTLLLTEKGSTRAGELLGDIYAAEERAIEATLQKYPPEFVEALEYFADRLQESFHAATAGKDQKA